MVISNIKQYASTVCGGKVIIERGTLPSNQIPARLAGTLKGSEVTIDWVYKFGTDLFVRETRWSLNDSNSYVLKKLEEEVRAIATAILTDNGIDIAAIKQTALDAKAAILAEQQALEAEMMLEDMDVIAEA